MDLNKHDITLNKNVELHIHTDASLFDGAQTYKALIDRAIELGFFAIAITNHGNAADLIDAWLYLQERKTADPNIGLKLIFGVEGYIGATENLYEDDEKEKCVRQHLVLIFKDKAGYQAGCRYISETNRHLDAKGFPMGDIEMLNKYFGPGTAGHGHVAASSACFAGPIAFALLFNRRVDHEISKIKSRMERSGEDISAEYIAAKTIVSAVDGSIDLYKTEIERLTPIAQKTFKDAKAIVKAEKDPDLKRQLSDELDAEMLETKEAKAKIKELKEKVKELNTSVKDKRKLLTALRPRFQTIQNNICLLKHLESLKKTDEELLLSGKEVAIKLSEIFGNEDFYCEVMYHGWEEEALVMPKIVRIAHDLGLKLNATNDVHMTNVEDFDKRQALRDIGLSSKKMPYEALSEMDRELYLKTAAEKAIFLRQILDEKDILEAIEGSSVLARSVTFDTIELGKHYPVFMDADEKLRELARDGHTVAYLENGKNIEISCERAGIKARYGTNWNEKLEERFNYEMGIISKMGFSSYFLFIADVINKCKSLYGTPIGPGRGSGVGSLVCYLTSITELEPLSLNLLFERFLNPERVSMPDIDTDFSKEARAYAIRYVTDFYGSKQVAGIMTKAKMGPKNALTDAPKVYSRSKDPSGLYAKAFSALGAELRAMVGDAKCLSDIEDKVLSKYTGNKDALAIWEIARKIEGTTRSYGQHAGGIISIMNDEVEDYIPLMMAEDDDGNKKMVIQADMVAAEANLGFIKFDFLGLKNLNIITATQKKIEDRYGKYIDTYSLPVDDPKVYAEIFAKGNTNFVFQFESSGMKGMLKQLNPTCFSDLVMAVSVYRPGPMEFIPSIIKCKSTGEDSEIVKRIPVLRDTLAETYGYPIYQEQVMKIMTLCAGFSMGHADNVRRFMSKKKEDKLAHERPAFVEGCKANGISEEDSNWLFDQLMPFAKYGFNKSHAATYSLVAYITGYLKLYYPAEYLASAMLEQGDKTIQFLDDCRHYGLKVLPVSVNHSETDYSVETDRIVRIGLSAIKGMKTEAQKIVEARKTYAFSCFEDFIQRSSLKKDARKACILSGACDDFVVNRDVAVNYAENYWDSYDSLLAAKTKIAEINDLLECAESEKEIRSLGRRLNTWTEKMIEVQNALNAFKMPDVPDLSMKIKTGYETKYLGMWMSGSPLEDYDLTDPRYSSIEELTLGNKITTLGVVTDYRQILTKNGEDMAFFSILDKESKSIPCVMFPSAFVKCGVQLEDNMVIEIDGKLSEDNEGETQINVWKVSEAEPRKGALVIDACDIAAFAEVVIPLIKKYKASDGIECKISNFCRATRETSFKVSAKITNELDRENIRYRLVC